ncbi:hypothetical protein RFI_03860 [Reticulomyxa filosa]|uniref:Phosphatidylethanolamine-binding protein n=1 Tax=Reticulomyxa filosa TaxID=46433 RepID=X6P6K2_RETFI|nr:hypothetical protein RFI_03860 [Reticulomyxa filosa]|eukprot:ETO33247.1 hypothetical protein RFI_03860 [Reticulomyxa filosa]
MAADPQSSTTIFSKNEIVPDVVKKAPASLCEVSYGDHKLTPGEKLSAKLVNTHLPKVTWAADAKKYYTLILTDPDAPSRKEPKYREWLHWIVTNIPGSDVSKGETLVWEQEGKNDKWTFGPLGYSSEKRGGFKAQQFASSNKLTQLVAGNFYQAENDDDGEGIVKQVYANLHAGKDKLLKS